MLSGGSEMAASIFGVYSSVHAPYVIVVGSWLTNVFIHCNTNPVDCGSFPRPAAGCVMLRVTRW